MRRRLLILAVAGAACLGSGACSSDDESQGGDGSASGSSAAGRSVEAPGTLVQEGSFTACMDASFPPMEYLDGQTPKGFDVAVIAAVAETWGVEPVYKNMNFDGLLPAVSSGRCDVAWSGMFVNEERTKTFGVVPYYETGTVLLVQSGNPEGIATPEDLAGKTLVAQTGTLLIDEAKALQKRLQGDLTVQAYPKASYLIQQLVVGRADAALTQDTEAGYRAKQNPGQFEVAYEYPAKETFGAYFGKDNDELGAGLRSALEQLDADGTLSRIAEEEGVPPGGLAVG